MTLSIRVTYRRAGVFLALCSKQCVSHANFIPAAIRMVATAPASPQPCVRRPVCLWTLRPIICVHLVDQLCRAFEFPIFGIRRRILRVTGEALWKSPRTVAGSLNPWRSLVLPILGILWYFGVVAGTLALAAGLQDLMTCLWTLTICAANLEAAEPLRLHDDEPLGARTASTGGVNKQLRHVA